MATPPPLTSGYQEFAPPPDLAPFVACTWSSISVATGAGTPAAVLPDGCADIITFGDDPPRVAWPHTTTRWIQPRPPGTPVVGIRLRPGAVRPVLRCDLSPACTWGLDLESVCGAPARTLHRHLTRSGDLEEHRSVLTAWTRGRLTGLSERDLAVIEAGRLLSGVPGIRIDDVAAHVGLPPRRLHRGFLAGCGYGPKTLQRIMRVQRALRIAGSPSPGLGLAGIAVHAGFSDQAHLSRDVRAITGFTAHDLLSHVDPDVGRWLETG